MRRHRPGCRDRARRSACVAQHVRGTCRQPRGHTADADSLGTLAVLAAQAAFGHLDLGTALELGTPKAAPVGAVDSQGKLRWVDGKVQDKPTPDNITVEFGKHKGKTLRVAGPNYCKWLLGSDFPDDVKNPIRAAWGPAAARW